MSVRRGGFSYMPFVDCGLCDGYDTLPDLTDCDDRPVEQRAEEIGWRETPEHGWLCSECAKSYVPTRKARTVKVKMPRSL
jgi:hypothetical protein